MIVTFYSYKGGVGRSMAMANVADILAHRGARVLMIDFDLEAPGLEQYFDVPQGTARGHLGLIDLLAAFKQAMAVGGARQADFREIDRFLLPVYQKLPHGGSLDLMPAGSREGADLDRYATAVRSFDWQDFYFNWEGELFFEWLREELTSKRYDLVLVDSRTGVTEMGGICSYQLADQILMLCAANRQNLRGTTNVAEDFTSARVMNRRHDRPLGIVVVPARIEQRDPALLEVFLTEFEATFAKYLPKEIRAAGLRTRDLMIPYQPEYAFEERVVTDPARGGRRIDIGGAFLELARAITLLAPQGSRVSGMAQSPDSGDAPLEYDVTTRFGGYDVHLAGCVDQRTDLEAIRDGLTDRGLQVFLDAVEPVPPDQWRQRSEQILFHSKVLVLVDGLTTGAQRDAISRLLRANRVAKNRPVRVVAFRGESPVGLATVLEVPSAESFRGAPDDPQTLDRLANMIHSSSRPSMAVPIIQPALASSAAPAGAAPSSGLAPEAVPPPPPPAPQAPQSATPSPSVAASQPFQGSDPFREDGAGYFFGRERLVADLVAALATNQRVWLLGPSGCGKTSAVLAGAFPILRSRAPGRGLERIEIGAGSVAAIEAALARMTPGNVKRVLFIDELERALGLPAAEREAIFAAVAAVATKRPDVVTLIGAREDVAQVFKAAPLLLDSSAPSTLWVPDFTAGELRAAIERPAEKSGLAYEPGLVDRILADAGLQATALRLVQKTLLRLWENRREGWLTNAGYERIGGIGAVVGEIGDTALARYPGPTEVLDRILARLVVLEPPAAPMPSAETSGTRPALVVRRRQSVPTADLEPTGGDVAAYRAAIEQLTMAGFLVARANEAEDACVELIHDQVIQRSARLAQRLTALIAADSEFMLWRQRFGETIVRREELRGKNLTAARAWLAKRGADLNAVERATITAAVRDQRLLRTIMVVVIGTIGFFVWREQRRDQVTVAVAAVVASDDLATRQQWTDAIDSLNAAADRYPFRDSLLLKRGRAHGALGDDSLAIADFTEGLALNPLLIDLRIERAATYLKAGDYHRATTDYDEIINSPSVLGNGPDGKSVILDHRDRASAYFGRAVARDRLKGNADSTLRDFEAAVKYDPYRIDALFESGSLNQRLGRTQAAIDNFQRFLAIATNPNDREAAQTRINSLRPAATPTHSTTPPRVTQGTVYIHYADPRDSSAIEQIRREIVRAGVFQVAKPDGDPNIDATVAELRYLSGDDRYVKDVLVVTEGALAKAGYRLRLETRALDPKRFPRARPGRFEVWLPPLNRSLYSAEQKKE